MYSFKNLKISGFKSFALPSEFLIDDGVTGIIGPNGCGKSNIFEAIRWVMGESSSKSLRSNSMDEVIFNGTEDVPAKNFAEVSIEIEKEERNSLGQLLGEEKVLISRSIERGVGSFYKINNKEVRAKDILIFFSDSGSGPRSSSIISQGNIDQIINFKPIERRVILEDAAGISGLQSRRHESELKLKATESNLERLSDNLNNLESQQKSLLRQARQAKQYEQITERIHKIESILLFLEWKDLESEFDLSIKKFNEIKIKLQETNKQHENLNSIKIKKDNEINITNKLIDKTNMDLQSKNLEKNNLLNEKESLKNRKSEIENYIKSISNDKNIEQKRLEEFEKSIAIINKKINSFNETNELKKTLQEKKTVEFKLQEELQNLELTLNNERQLLLGEEFKLDNLKESQEYHLNKINSLKNQILNAEKELRTFINNQPIKDMRILEKEKKEINQIIKNLQIQNFKIEKENNDKDKVIFKTREEMNVYSKDLTKYITEINTLKRLIKEADLHSDSIFNLLKIKKGYENAVYSALRDELDAQLKKSKKRWVDVSLEELPKISNPLKQYVNAPRALDPILSQILIVEDLEEGNKKQKDLKFGQVIVSKEGTLWRWDGFISEKNTENKNWLEYQTRIMELEGLIKNIKEKIQIISFNETNLGDQKQKLIKDINLNQKLINEQIKKQKSNDLKFNDLKENDIQNKNQIAQLSEKINFLNKEKRTIEIELKKIITAQKKNNEQLKNKPKNNSKFTQTLINEIKRDIEAHRADIDEINEKILADEINFKYLQNDLKQNELRKSECISQIMNLSSRERDYLKQKDKISEFPETLEKKISIIQDKTISLELRKKEILLKNSDNKKYLEEIILKINESSILKEKLKENFIRTEENIIHLKEKKTNLGEIIFQRLKCSPHEILTKSNIIEYEIKKNENYKITLEKLIFQRDQMGPVNLRASLEEKEITSELNHLELEKNDLLLAIQKLRIAITQINSEGKKKIVDAFELVNQNFSQLFEKLFSGGKASLELVNSDDPLQTGLEIFAKPPGKKLTNINLLSGGEKALTAISLIFSIFLINPSPLCILDEVDAALDDVNVEKFCEILDEIKKKTKTKFLIVTHHKTTMTMADRVYGITMSQKGISDIISVNFDSETFQEAS